ncbi:MAG: BadF/BadG/BcrA/BcrD ATPase family protein [Vulcanimicrobiaceae bacterium]
MTAYFAGIDGGQTGTTAVVGDERGNVLGRGEAGPADEVGEPPGSTRLRDALNAALRGALAAAKLPSDTRLEAVVAGVSGYRDRARGVQPAFAAQRSSVVHDAPVAHAGAFAGGAGVAIVVGTGSVAYARDASRSITLGGWGYLFGDEGSAFWIGREAIAKLMRAQDDGDEVAMRDRDALLAFFERSSLRDVQDAYAGGELSRARVASYAPAALASPYFDDVAQRGAERLADLAGAAMRALDLHDAGICFTGGLCDVETYRERLYATLRVSLPRARPREPRYDPSTGALLLAYREAGLPAFEIVQAP